jgi:hypothetical protein
MGFKGRTVVWSIWVGYGILLSHEERRGQSTNGCHYVPIETYVIMGTGPPISGVNLPKVHGPRRTKVSRFSNVGQFRNLPSTSPELVFR